MNFILIDKETTYYAIVIATNGAELKTVVSSGAFKMDVTTKISGSVLDGLHEDIDYINSSVSFATTWSEFHDPETGMEKCMLTASEENPVAEVSMSTLLKMKVKASGSIIHGNLTLTPGLRYVSPLECENPDGFRATSSSNGVIVDDSPPVGRSIFDGNSQGADVRFQASVSTLNAHWIPTYDSESGLTEYLAAVGSWPNEDDLYQFFSVGLATEAKIENLTLQSG